MIWPWPSARLPASPGETEEVKIMNATPSRGALLTGTSRNRCQSRTGSPHPGPACRSAASADSVELTKTRTR